MDLVFVLDASTKVTRSNFLAMKDFVKDFLFMADIDTGKARVGVMIYSAEAHVQFQLNTYQSKPEVLRAIDAIPYRSGSRNTAAALKSVRTEMFSPSHGDRGAAPNVAILISAGSAICSFHHCQHN